MAIPGQSRDRWVSYLGILGYLDKGEGACVWSSLDNLGMATLLGNPAILGQGGRGEACVWTSLDNLGMAKLLGNPGILGQGGACAWLDNPGMAKLLGNPGILGQGGRACVWPSLDNPGMVKLLGNLGNS